MKQRSLVRFAWLSIAAAVATITLKSGAYLVTSSVGLLSDALESLVNLAAAIVALSMLRIAARPADENHHYGHDKAEYFSSVFEGGMILLAAIAIGITAVKRFIHPRELIDIEIGVTITVIASLINYIVARILSRAGAKHNSITLKADAQHLMTDVWTSAGVVVGVAATRLTGWQRLDPIVAMVVAANIVRSGFRLVQHSILGLMDTALPANEINIVREILDRYRQNEGIDYHAIRTRMAASRRFVSFHILVPGNWSVQRGHDLLEKIEADLHARLQRLTVTTHLEPIEDPVSWRDTELDRVHPD
jgi:cation diffusion facilitator family transporter